MNKYFSDESVTKSWVGKREIWQVAGNLTGLTGRKWKNSCANTGLNWCREFSADGLHYLIQWFNWLENSCFSNPWNSNSSRIFLWKETKQPLYFFNCNATQINDEQRMEILIIFHIHVRQMINCSSYLVIFAWLINILNSNQFVDLKLVSLVTKESQVFKMYPWGAPAQAYTA